MDPKQIYMAHNENTPGEMLPPEIGDRIILHFTDDPSTTGVYRGEILPIINNWLFSGAMGTVFGVDKGIMPKFWVHWDNGRKLALLPQKDRFSIVRKDQMDLGNLAMALISLKEISEIAFSFQICQLKTRFDDLQMKLLKEQRC